MTLTLYLPCNKQNSLRRMHHVLMMIKVELWRKMPADVISSKSGKEQT